jgi:hypothetical protein
VQALEYVNERARQVAETRRARRAAMLKGYQDEAAAVVVRLRERGLEIDDLWDLVNGPNEPYVDHLPALLEELGSASHVRVREGLVRALSIPQARGVASGPLLREMRRATAAGEPDTYRWVIGNALRMVATARDRAELEEIALDDAHGTGRQGAVEALARLPASSRTAAVVARALADERLAPFALKVIARHAIRGFEDRIAELERDEREWVAQRAVAARRSLAGSGRC